MRHPWPFRREALLQALSERDILEIVDSTIASLEIHSFVRWRRLSEHAPPTLEDMPEIIMLVIETGADGRLGAQVGDVGPEALTDPVDVPFELQAIVEEIDRQLPPLGMIRPTTPVQA